MYMWSTTVVHVIYMIVSPECRVKVWHHIARLNYSGKAAKKLADYSVTSGNLRY